MMTHQDGVMPIVHPTEGYEGMMGKIRDFRDLIVWQRAIELSKACFDLIEQAPRRATRGLATQLLDAADSVAANIAEGHGRPTRQDYLRFLGIAHASLREVRSHLMTLEHARDVRGPRVNLALALVDECGRMLTVLQRRLREN